MKTLKTISALLTLLSLNANATDVVKVLRIQNTIDDRNNFISVDGQSHWLACEHNASGPVIFLNNGGYIKLDRPTCDHLTQILSLASKRNPVELEIDVAKKTLKTVRILSY